jgi:hypothetical protein
MMNSAEQVGAALSADWTRPVRVCDAQYTGTLGLTTSLRSPGARVAPVIGLADTSATLPSDARFFRQIRELRRNRTPNWHSKEC